MRSTGSLIILETTLETSAVVLEYRRRFQPVCRIDPTDALGKLVKGIPRKRTNVLDPFWCNPDDRARLWTRTAKVALGQVPEEQTREPFFNNTARHLAKVLDMAEVILRPPGLANVGRVAKIAFEDPIHYCKWAARQIKGHPELVSELLRYCRPGIDQVKSIQEVVQSLCTHTACFNEPVIADCLRSADLWFGNCRRVPQTISIVSPIENQGANNHFLSFCLEQIFAQIQSAQFDGLIPVAIVVDEFGAYPRMESVRLPFSSLRKFNSFIALAVNDYGTLVDTYGKQAAEGFLENAGMVQYMSTKSTSGCTHLSEMLGDIQVDSENIAITNPTPGSQGNPTVNRTHSKQRRRLLEPFEIAQLGSQEQIVKMSGVSRPILCSKRPYYETNLARKAARNPFFRKG